MRRLLTLVALIYFLTSATLLGWTFLWPAPNFGALPKADAILCLGGGLTAQGALPRPVKTRIDTCIKAQAASGSPLVIFTGGTRRPGHPPAGAQMMSYALRQGLPPEVAKPEIRSRSTLQNALFSLQMVPNPRRLIVVTEAFHLPRSAASIRWAAWQLGLPQPQITQVMSEPVRRRNGAPAWRILARESLALWFNLARALAFSAVPGTPLHWLD